MIKMLNILIIGEGFGNCIRSICVYDILDSCVGICDCYESVFNNCYIVKGV